MYVLVLRVRFYKKILPRIIDAIPERSVGKSRLAFPYPKVAEAYSVFSDEKISFHDQKSGIISNRKMSHPVLMWKHISNLPPPVVVKCDDLNFQHTVPKINIPKQIIYLNSYPYLKENLDSFMYYQINEALFQGKIIKGQINPKQYIEVIKNTSKNIDNFNPLNFMDVEQPFCTIKTSDLSVLNETKTKISLLEEQLERHLAH
ncbi:hypothetical protein HZS_5321 [Henneguya salminicola]|nr:hypothetical protein HZS_5321 [Henneguya salminicola]